jgi:hypothetical protein
MTRKRRDLLRVVTLSTRVSSDGEGTAYFAPALDPRLQGLLDRDIEAIARSAPSRTPEQLLARLEARRAAPSPARRPTRRRARIGRVGWTGVAFACAALGAIVAGVTGHAAPQLVVAAGFLIVEVSERLVRAAADRCGDSLKFSLIPVRMLRLVFPIKTEAQSTVLANEARAVLTIETPPDTREE